MISFETQKMIFDILLAVAESERSIEAIRQMLNETIKDSSHHLFQLLDVSNTNSISSDNLITFMEIRRVYMSLNEAQMIIMFYDSNNDGLLSYYEFLNLAQSATVTLPINLRSKEVCGCPLTNDNNDFLLVKLLEIELLNVKTILQLLKSLQAQNDFSINDLFDAMKQYNSISLNSLVGYFDKHKVNISYKDITHIMHRLDFNKDGKIDQAEFFSFFGYQSNLCHFAIPKQQMNSLNDINVIRNALPEERTYSLGHSIKGVNRFNESTLNLRLSPKRQIINEQSTNAKKNIKENNRFNKSIEENEFLEYITYLMQIESKIEKDKIDLAQRPDFNIYNAFQLFTKSSPSTFITEDDLKRGLAIMEIFASSDEVTIMMNRFDLRNEGVISFLSFFDMVTPFESSERNTLQNRRPRNKPFMMSTKIYYQGLLRIIIASESKLNTLKTGFTSVNSKLKEIFTSIDQSNKGYFTIEDWDTYLELNKAFDDKKSAALVFIRLDRKRCGKVSYCDLNDELTPCD